MELIAAVNETKAEEVFRLLKSKEPIAKRQALTSLRDIQNTVKSRQKRNRTYALTVQALEHQYTQWQRSARQQLAHLDTHVAGLNHQVTRLRQQRGETEQRLSGYERELQGIRTYAQQRRTKKTKREKQYNHFYFVPILSNQYHKKYIRAHDKNASAEEQVVQIRESIESCQEAVRQAANQLIKKQQEHDAQLEQREAVHSQVAEADKCLNYLHQGQQFWDHFDEYQATVLIESCDRLIERFRSNSGDTYANGFPRRQSSSTPCRQQEEERDWAVVFRTVCKEYAEREAYGAEKWDSVEVDFDCARCRQSLIGWPTPDKVHTSDLLCAACYQETRTSMIMEKKMNAWGGKLGIERPVSMERRRSSSSSTTSNNINNGKNNRLSTPSTNNKRPLLLSSSSSSFVGDATKATKKMFKIFTPSSKKQQRRQSADSPTVLPLATQQQQTPPLPHNNTVLNDRPLPVPPPTFYPPPAA
ncbi:hypothetical protein INT45_004219 [Circinella minor]|uniref:Uncharacterized protein n=1 Tax=Circinella minor TaxID=1195481 RepID=A0A8H7VIE4_9FUNG|nr:hypothetical protein INT45_004219 [Circinella minor]